MSSGHLISFCGFAGFFLQWAAQCTGHSCIARLFYICPEGKPDPAWLALTEKYSGRICLGSDMVTKFERIGPELQRYDVFLDQLSEEARANLCWRTAEKIYGGNKGKVSAGNEFGILDWDEVSQAKPGG